MVETEGKVGVRKRKITEERVIRGKGGTVRKGERSQEGGKKGTKGKRPSPHDYHRKGYC